MNTRFTPLQRLHNSREFANVLGSRLTLRGASFSLHHVGSATGVARLGLILPKRLARQAVTRNLIRRQAREVFRGMASGLPPLDLVLRLTRVLKVGGPERTTLKQSFRAEIETLFELAVKGLSANRAAR